MRIDGVRLVYFSPTGTTRKVLGGIARGLGFPEAECYDLTQPRQRQWDATPESVLTLLGAPVYAGRLPATAVARLRRVQGRGSPAVLVVVYGNRAYEDALLELRDLALDGGFTPVAAGAFVGEHSFSAPNTPIAVGRPDADDLRRAQEFGRIAAGKLAVLPGLAAMDPLRVPGNLPYKDVTLPGGVAPETREAECAHCGQCVTACPVGAVRLTDGVVVTDKALCIRCCACVKGCPTGARVVTDVGMLQTATRLATNCRQRKEPEYFL